MNDNLMITEAAKALNVHIDDVKIVKRLMGGMSHLTYHISVFDKEMTLRIIGKDGNKFVDRTIEYENINRIKPLDINHELIYFDIESGTKIGAYIKGEVLSTLDYKPHLDQVVKTLKTLHQSFIKPVNDYGFKERLSLYESFLDTLDDQYLKLKNIWFELYEKSYQFQPKVFCHNDAQRSNMVLAEEKLYLLDWEYAGLNPFYYDIASFGNVSFEDALVLLESYLSRKPTEQEVHSVYYYRMFQALQWHLVASYKHRIGLSEILQFDFFKLNKKYLDLAETLYQTIRK